MNKTVLITGSSRGIGRAAALAFGGAGYNVVINCMSQTEKMLELKREIEKTGAACLAVQADAGDPDGCELIFSEAEARFGFVDVLINNAGIAHIGLLTDMTDQQWQDIINTNLSSVFYCCRSAVPPMITRKQGRIINISSMWGTSGASCEAAYSASKSGVHGLTRALAKELAPSNIQVNAVACGVIDTAMNSQLDARERQALEEDIPSGRFGRPEEVARLVWDLSQAPDYLTGQIIGIDGGYI